MRRSPEKGGAMSISKLAAPLRRADLLSRFWAAWAPAQRGGSFGYRLWRLFVPQGTASSTENVVPWLKGVHDKLLIKNKHLAITDQHALKGQIFQTILCGGGL
jgi:hypothetical protein